MSDDKYDCQFKQRAVLFWYENGQNTDQTAEQLCIPKNILHRWCREYRLSHGKPESGLNTDTASKKEEEQINDFEKELRKEHIEQSISRKNLPIFNSKS